MCNKHKYQSKRDANIQIKSIKTKSKRDKVPQRSYFCVECDCYHITATKEERSESIEFRSKKTEQLRKFKLK
jgi:hypothetical protein